MRRSNSIILNRRFKEQTKFKDESVMLAELKKILQTEKNVEKRDVLERQLNSFMNLFRRYLNNPQLEIDWNKISLVDKKSIRQYGDLMECPHDQIEAHLHKFAVVKLNGGLGTSMGCTGTKSLISVRSDFTFLDLTIQQIEDLNVKYNCKVPLVLMNSFNTHEETMRVLPKYEAMNIEIMPFVQSMYPRINKDSLLPICSSATSPNDNWYPPGHGDLYRSLHNSGILTRLIDRGVQWIFVSNIDNLGATIDQKILSYLVSGNEDKTPEFVMEVTDKTRADVKGGTLIKYEDQLRLLEIAQVPKDHIDEFTSVRKFDIFNTNNLWINLNALQNCLAENRLQMEIIVNSKNLNNGLKVIQLEEASGAAVKSFQNAVGLRVPRSRFLPVKTTSDLLLVMSNIYEMCSDRLYMSPLREFSTVPVVKLGGHFRTVKDFLRRFENIPDLLELDHLTVSGDVTFGQNVSLRGTVIIIANFGDIINIPSGTRLENKIVSGNLRILDH